MTASEVDGAVDPARPAHGTIIGVGRSLGERVITNADLEASLQTTDDWISSRTGIRERRFVSDEQDAVTLASDAAREAIENAGVPADSIDLIVCATSTGPESMPSVACLVGESVGAVGVGAMDVAAACAGYAYAVSVAASMLATGTARRALVIGSDAMSRIVDQSDRSTAVIFGDGAGAVVLDADGGESGFVDHLLGADGRMAPLGRAGHPGDEQKLYQNGREVFKFAVKVFPEMVEKLVARNGIALDEVQYIIPHQANARIIQAAARKLDTPEERIVMNVERFGNTSAASIPLSYPDLYESFESGRYVITVGFGFGLAWAANLYRI